MSDDAELGARARDTSRIAAFLARGLGPAIAVEGCDLATIKRLPADAGLLVSYRVRLHDRAGGARLKQLYSALLGGGPSGPASVARDGLAAVEMGPAAIDVPELGATLLAFPNDPLLPSLAQAFTAQAVASCLSHAHGRRVAVVELRTAPLKYDPGTGCTCRVSGSAQIGEATTAFDLVGKTHRSDRLARTFATMSRLEADPAVRSGSWRIARPLFYDAGRKLLWQEALRGQSFWTLYPNLDVAATFRRMAAAAAAFHAIPFAPPGRELSELPESRPDLIDMWPDLGARHARLLERLLRARATLSPAEPASLHGDFHPEQFLIDGDQIALTDFDSACWGDAAHDAGRFASHVVLKTLQRDLGLDRFTDALEAFYDEYARRSAAPDVRPRLFWHVAAQLLGRRVHKFVKHAAESPDDRIARMLDVAEAYLDRLPR